MPDTRRQVVLETIFFFLGLMFDAYSINLGASSAMKIFAQNGTNKSTAPHALTHAVVVSLASAKV